MSTRAKYKIWDGSNWVVYWFETIATQVSPTTSRKWITSSVTVNSQPFTLGTGDAASLTLVAANICGTYTSHNYVSANENLDAVVSALDNALGNVALSNGNKISKDGQAGLAGTYIFGTGGHGTQTINLAKAQPHAGDTITVNIGSATVPFDKIYADNFYGALTGNASSANYAMNAINATNATNYSAGGNIESGLSGKVPTTRKVNAKALDANIVLYGTDIAMSSGDSTTIQTAISNVVAVAQGRTSSFVINHTPSPAPSPAGHYINGSLNSSAADITVSYNEGTPANHLLRKSDGTDVSVKNLKLGDVIYLKDVDLPDRWVSSATGGATGTIVFSKLETMKVDLTAYATQDWVNGKAYWSNASHPTTLTDYGITDAKIVSGVITLGGNTIKPITSVTNANPTLSWGGSSIIGNVGGTSLTVTMPPEPSYSDTKNTAGANQDTAKLFLVGAKAQTTGGAGAQTYSNVKAYIGTDGCLYSNSKRVPCVSSGTGAPASPISGDIWVDTTV